jgi:hypothetical protein
MPEFTRATEDLGNIVHLEHVNVGIDDQWKSTVFHVTGLGLTRDPYCMTGVDNMWINVGKSQFHLLTGAPGRFNGHVGLVVPSLERLVSRLESVAPLLGDTKFGFSRTADSVLVTSPWGLSLKVHEPAAEFGPHQLGIPYVAFDAPVGSLDGIAKFYREVMLATVTTTEEPAGKSVRCGVGVAQDFVFRESSEWSPSVGDVHFQMYLANFSAPYTHLVELGLISEESDRGQYRFEAIVDLDTRKPIMPLGHEIRSMRHPMYGRQLVNRDPDRSSMNYIPGKEDLRWQDALP